MQEDGSSLPSTPWPFSHPHFEHNTAKTPDVDLGIVPFLFAVDDLRCHPKDGSLYRFVGTNDHINVVRPLRDSKTRYFTKSELLLDEDVVRF